MSDSWILIIKFVGLNFDSIYGYTILDCTVMGEDKKLVKCLAVEVPGNILCGVSSTRSA